VHQQSGGEFHNFSFTGDLPVTPPVPEPTSAAIVSGLMLIGALAGRHRS
jgi:hypothetical protein